MAALMENYERKLQSELMDFYERMVLPERSTLSSAGVGFVVDTKQLQNYKYYYQWCLHICYYC